MATALQTGSGQQWSQLITLFSETKKVYTSEDPFLSPQRLGFKEQGSVDTVKKANMATFISSLFGGREDVGFSHLNEYFLDTFAVDGTKFLKPHAQLFLNLKTQAYISAITSDKAAILTRQRSREEILNALFPPELDKLLLRRRSGAAQLTMIERHFIEEARSRRVLLLEESQSEGAIDMLPQKHSWEGFLRDFHAYIKGNINEITGNLVSLEPSSPIANSSTDLITSTPQPDDQGDPRTLQEQVKKSKRTQHFAHLNPVSFNNRREIHRSTPCQMAPMTLRRKQRELLISLWKTSALIRRKMQPLKTFFNVRMIKFHRSSKSKHHERLDPLFSSTSKGLSIPMFPRRLLLSSLRFHIRMAKCKVNGIRALAETPNSTCHMRTRG